MKFFTAITIILFCSIKAFAQNKNWTLHFQQTVIPQHKLKLNAPYSGAFSLSDTAETQTSLTTTIYIGRRLWKGGSAFYNPELAGGSGLSQARGIAGFTNGECFRIGNPSPTIYTARVFLRQDFALSKNQKAIKPQAVEGEAHAYPTEINEDGINSIGGERPADRFTIVVGKFSIADYFDNNSYAHDPRSQLMNWSLMSNGAWDYPANTRGYTWSALAEIVHPNWEFRLATSLVPTYANGPNLNWKWAQNQSNTIEFGKNTKLFGKDGKLRILAFSTKTYMGNYDLATQNPNPDVTLTRKPGRTKSGFGINYESRFTSNSAFFIRGSWNDGKNETWAFTEIDKAVSIGYVFENPFGRNTDRFNIAFALNGISDQHRSYLAKGGNGFIIGDGKLPNYGSEKILEINYVAKINEWLSLTPDYQLVINPAYNKDRGPVHAFAIRLHTEF